MECRSLCFSLIVLAVNLVVGNCSELGSACTSDKDCTIPHSRCSGVCVCQPYFAEYNSTVCLQSTLLDHECYVHEQCSMKVADSTCSGGICRCSKGFLRFRRHTCLGPAKPGDVCYSDEHCHLWSRNSHCDFLIPNLFGKCSCNEKGKGLYCSTKEISQALKEQPPILLFTSSTTEKLSTSPTEASTSQEESNQSSFEEGQQEEDEEEMNQYFFFTPHTTNTDPSHKDPFYSQKTHVEEESKEENTTEISPNDIPEVTENTNESSLEQSVETTDKTFTKTNSKLMDESVYQDALKLLSKITTKEKSETTTKSYSEAKYRGNVEEPSSPISQTTESLLGMDKVVYDKLFGKLQSKENRAISLGYPCSTDLQCRLADPGSRCINGACDCAAKENGTELCGIESAGCSSSTFQCRSSGKCISWFFVCDGRVDCPDGSDEECSGPICPRHSFQCGKSLICVSRSAVCDGTRNCPDGEDEYHCHTKNKTIKCPEYSFQCANGQCVPEFEFCNAIPSCSDGSDEPTELCRSHLKGKAGKKTEDEYCPFQCGNGRCRSTAILCSGRDGCGDNSDEISCNVCRCPKIP